MQEHPTPGDGGRALRREQPIQKAARLITENRVRILTGATVYLVAGDSDLYQVIVGPEGAIMCPCNARTPLCAHVLAVAHIRGAREAADPQVSVRAGVLS